MGKASYTHVGTQTRKATGILELSTGYSWHDAKESMTVNTSNGIFEMNQMDSLIYKGKQTMFMGVPLEKVYPLKWLKFICSTEMTSCLLSTITR